MTTTPESLTQAPFDSQLLDDLMEAAGLDALVATSKHNVQYLLGGHRFFWFEHMDAVGVSRYLPVVIYLRGRPEDTYYVANEIEFHQLDNNPVWVQHLETTSWGINDAIASTLLRLEHTLGSVGRIGIEPSFLPVAAERLLAKGGAYELVDAELVLERVRACKTPSEVDLVTRSADRIVDAILATFARAEVGMTKHDMMQVLREEEAARGLTYEYCLLNMGSAPQGFNRGPSEQRLQHGDILCLDTGGNYAGFIGDIARMGVVGEPDAELVDLLDEVTAIQAAARELVTPESTGHEVFAAAGRRIDDSPFADHISFVAHGMGLISHEAPRLTAEGPIPYPDADGPHRLRPGMVLSVETTLSHPQRGFVKLEDTLIVTADGHAAVGDHGRGWNVTGTSTDREELNS